MQNDRWGTSACPDLQHPAMPVNDRTTLCIPAERLLNTKKGDLLLLRRPPLVTLKSHLHYITGQDLCQVLAHTFAVLLQLCPFIVLLRAKRISG